MSAIESAFRLNRPWQTFDPFLFSMHHLDAFPEGNEFMGPAPGVSGRNIGSDFSYKDGWSMYHGQTIPGFTRHPHRGFETITLVRTGRIDHADSLGATARFGDGDVQWMTAGGGICHSEMFPLLKRDAANPLELFQIWLNLPARNKMVAPYFTMLWGETIPRHSLDGVEIVTVAGALDERTMPTPPPDSWASDPTSDLAIWTITMKPGARWTLPAHKPGLNRALYYFKGGGMKFEGRQSPTSGIGLKLKSDASLELENGKEVSELVLLEGRPIGEPVFHHGPFVMATQKDLEQAFVDYRATQFGGWPWDGDAPVHDRRDDRFAIHADGRREEPTSA